MRKTVPVLQDVDVLVAGGGPAGIGAAVSAARQSVSVLVIERYGFLGGVFTSCDVPSFMGFYHRGRKVAGGVADELVNDLARQSLVKFVDGPTRNEIAREQLDERSLVIIDGERAKKAFEGLVTQAGAEILFHAWASSPVMLERRVTGLCVETRGGAKAVRAKVVIDATGDGHVAALCGVPHTGDSRQNQAKSLVFRFGGVGPMDIKAVHAQIRQDQQAGVFPFPKHRLTHFIPLFVPGQVMVNMTQAGGDSTDCRELSRMEMDLREQGWQVFEYLTDRIEAFKDAYVVSSGVQAGIRQSRNFRAMHTLCENDLRQAAPSEDAIALAVGLMGSHDPAGAHYPHLERLDSVCQVPFHCLVPENVEGLLLSGRCIGVEPRIQDAIRLMPICMATGSAAGTAAALAAQSGCRLADVPVTELQAALRQGGAILA
ncbi:MAG: FAD-dependent oxidoreductase [Kiritimatiellae bacterium]|nr:FAD-dependent oxidoreductase [Kiritimatiellia bacterium]